MHNRQHKKIYKDINPQYPQLINMIINAAKSIDNGTITIIKQDNNIIQINTSEKFQLG
ncbi:MAG: YezD family protein [Clostridia bacterium]|nr:YezD family protein [Clostridia bacterium]